VRGVRIRPVPAFTPFIVVSIVQVVAIGAGADALVQVTKPLLMPALAIAVVLARLGTRYTLAVGLLLLAIGLSWLGDLSLMVPGDLWFVVGLGSFLLAHVAYLVLFIRIGGFGRPRVWAIVYAVWFVVFLAVLIPGLGSLVVPVVLYGLVLGAMAAMATRVSVVVGVGAAVFVVSDTILALSRFLPAVVIPGHDVLTMLTYCLGQGIIAAGVLAVLARSTRAGTAPAPTRWSGARAA
jgi:uncharacterized membrane protein YhhN